MKKIKKIVFKKEKKKKKKKKPEGRRRAEARERTSLITRSNFEIATPAIQILPIIL